MFISSMYKIHHKLPFLYFQSRIHMHPLCLETIVLFYALDSHFILYAWYFESRQIYKYRF